MSFSEYFPVFGTLSPKDQELLLQMASFRRVPAGTILHNGHADCIGPLVIRSGQLRAYMTSPEGREITLYRLLERDICVLSAACVMKSIQFDVTIVTEKDTELWVIPPYIYKALMEENASVANYINDILSARFTEVMWLVDQVMWKSFDKRLAHFLLEECALDNTRVLKITHEIIAGHLGTAREVVTRMLKYFQSEGMVKLTRGTIELTDEKRLSLLDE